MVEIQVAVEDPVRLKGLLIGLAGLLETVALHVKQPPVIAAANAAFLDLAVLKRGAAVHAARIQKTDSTELVTKDDQILAEQPYHLRTARHMGRRQDGLPVAAHPFAAGRPRTYLSKPQERGSGGTSVGTAGRRGLRAG